MHERSRRRGLPRTFALSVIAVLALVLMAACGDDDDSTPGSTLDQTPGASSTSVTAPASTDATPAGVTTPADTDATMPAEMTMPAGASTEDMGEIGACFQENTDAAMLEELRAGDSTMAQEVYTTCLEEMLPESMVADLEPVIEQAAACGVTAAEDLTDEDIAALEAGDSVIAEQVSEETLDCLSDELGMPLS